MRYKTEKLGEPLAQGKEKTIYEHPHDSEKVIGEIRNDVFSASQMKGRYYLTKILHLLLPQNIPDVHFVERGPAENSQMVMQRKKLDPEHETLRDLASRQQAKFDVGESDAEINSAVSDTGEAMAKKLNADPAFRALEGKITSLGLLRDDFDDAPKNFGYDTEGNLVYIDNSFLPWTEGRDGEIEPKDYGKLYEAIQSLDDKDRGHAMAYFERLEALRGEAVAEQEKSKVRESGVLDRE